MLLFLLINIEALKRFIIILNSAWLVYGHDREPLKFMSPRTILIFVSSTLSVLFMLNVFFFFSTMAQAKLA